MKLQINKSKPQMVGVRLRPESYKWVKDRAKKEGVSLAEVARALIEAALSEVK